MSAEDITWDNMTYNESRNQEYCVLFPKDIDWEENRPVCTLLKDQEVGNQDWVIFVLFGWDELLVLAYIMYDLDQIFFRKHIFFPIPISHDAKQKSYPGLMLELLEPHHSQVEVRGR